jgi:hypothetical protein
MGLLGLAIFLFCFFPLLSSSPFAFSVLRSNLFPVEQLRPVEHLGPAKAAHRREEPYAK